jgi:general secretion pathway protein D
MTKKNLLNKPLPLILGVSMIAGMISFSPSAQAGPSGFSGGSTNSIAEREFARRLERVRQAEQEIAEGDKLAQDKDLEAAIGKYRSALEKLPKAPMTQPLRDRATASLADVTVEYADQLAKQGNFPEARSRLEFVLSPEIAPDHREAKKILARLDDPEYYNQAMTPEHVEDVQEVDRLLRLATGYYDIGRFDNAEKQYNAVLRVDPYNETARRGMESVELARQQYYKTSRDHMRAKMLSQVDSLWEWAVPTVSFGGPDRRGGETSSTGVEYIRRKLKTIKIPEIDFTEATIEEAVEFLRRQAKELDPTGEGVNIIIKSANQAPGGDGIEPDPGAIGSAPINLQLSNVPLEDALKFTTELAGLKYKVDPLAVIVVPGWFEGGQLVTQTFRVPPDFLTGAGDDGGGGGGALEDPFDPGGGGGGGTSLQRKKNAKEVLAGVGVPFPDGTSATYIAATSELVVRNTQSNMDLIQTYVDSIIGNVKKQILVTTKFVEVTQENNDELGFDWLLGAFNIPGSKGAFGAGGTVGNQSGEGFEQGSFPFTPPGSDIPVGQNPLTAGLRSGSSAIQNNAIDGLLSQVVQTTTVAPGIFGVAGVFTDPQFQVIVRALSQKKGADLMSAPSVVTTAGQRAKIEIIREFIYPTEYDPPEIPQTFGGGGNNGGGFGGIGGGGGGGGGGFPVTPANPTAFDVRNVGVTMEVEPNVDADGFTISLNLAPEVVEFEGFINYGSPIQTSATNALGQPVQVTLTENRILQPVFSVRKVTTNVTIWDGQTVAIGGLIREDVQETNDKVPFLGDMPLVGRLFRSQAENHFKRNLMIFVTARLIDPSGQPINRLDERGTPEDSDNSLFPGGSADGM